ncbi:DUF317 domain-containing protein [Streptomyces sp. NPDC048340]|uniref:DUF317 domain-containing protein n=1 Tax=Streptomyces sp. NPDC048340 TaxID=3365537 RepID=UPI00370FAB64
MSISERQLSAFASDHDKLGSAISPRYLAGPGDPRHITHALHAAGWASTSDPLHPAIRMTSPDRVHRLDLNPAEANYSWRISPESGHIYWSATFSAATPVEIVAGFTDTLARPAPFEESAPAVVERLAAHGWTQAADHTGSQILLSPEGSVQATPRDSPSAALAGWEFVAARQFGPYGPEGLMWRAHVSKAAPGHLVAALADAVSTPEPVLRARYDHACSPHVVAGPEFAISTKMLAAHKARVAQARRFRPRPAQPTVRTVAPAPAGRTPAAPAR